MPRGRLVLIAALVAGLSLAACASSQSATPSGRFISRNVPISPVPAHPSTAAPVPLPVSVQPRPPVPTTGNPMLPPAGTGIAGLTGLDPACPVQRMDAPCVDRPIAARLAVLDAATGSLVTTVYSGRDGHFRVAVNPGRYLLRVVNVAGVRPHSPTEVGVTVKQGRYTSVIVHIDTGIR